MARSYGARKFSPYDPLGSDLETRPDGPALNMNEISGIELVKQDLESRFRCWLFWDPDYGYPLHTLSGAHVTRNRAQIAARCVREVLKDPRVLDASAEVAFDDRTRILTVNMHVVLYDDDDLVLTLNERLSG